jgi:hypothetical protein
VQTSLHTDEVVGWASLCILLVDYTEIYNMGIGKKVTNEWLDGVWIKGAIQLGLTPELSTNSSTTFFCLCGIL